MARSKPLSLEELVAATGGDKKLARHIYKEQTKDRPRRFKYVAFLTEAEAKDCATLTEQTFEQARKRNPQKPKPKPKKKAKANA